MTVKYQTNLYTYCYAEVVVIVDNIKKKKNHENSLTFYLITNSFWNFKFVFSEVSIDAEVHSLYVIITIIKVL